MTKADIVSEIAKSTGIEKVQVQTVVEAFMESVKGSLIQGNDVFLRGFGSFIVKKRAQKVARNILKGTTITRIQACEELRCEGKINRSQTCKTSLLCQTEKSTSVIRWLPTSARSVCARIVIRRSR